MNVHRDRDRLLQLLILNEEFLVNASHQACIDYVPALCTHRPSHLPIEWSGETLGLWLAPSLELDCENLSKPYHLEEGEVVTRFP